MGLAVTSVLTAVWFGMLTSINPCPLATNVAAMSFVGMDLASPRKVLLTGLPYAAGRSLAYAVLAGLLIQSIFAIPDLSFWLSTYMNKVLGPLLVVVGLILLEVLPFRFAISRVTGESGRRLGRSGPWGAGLLGVLFALSFCPVSAALFFGSLLPLSARSGSSVLLPSAYCVGTGVPVLFFAVLIATSAQWVGRAFKQFVQFEKWVRRITGAVFVLVGLRHRLIYISEVQI